MRNQALVYYVCTYRCAFVFLCVCVCVHWECVYLYRHTVSCLRSLNKSSYMMYREAFLFFTCLACFCMVLDAGTSLRIQIEALKAFKSSVSRDPLGALADWSDAKHHCNWSGIICGSPTTNVISISLSQKQLQGKISPSLQNISTLEVLDLTFNSLEGSIPHQLGHCSRLIELSLKGNFLSGPIPVEIGNLTNLQSIDLSRNKLSGNIPPSVGNLSNLENLEFSENMLVGSIPFELGYCRKLINFHITDNHIRGEIPSNIGWLNNLVNITLNNNLLEGAIPSSISNCSNLYDIGMDYNKLSGELPPKLGKLGDLAFLTLQGNKFSGEIPADLYNCSSLFKLDVSFNHFSGMISTLIGKLSNLYSLEAYVNSLTGPIPIEIGNSSMLLCLGLGWNRLSGSIPPPLVKVTRLQGIYLNDNSLEGVIPEKIFTMTALHTLAVQRNKLTGPIPDAPFEQIRLLSLNLSGNMLSGAIPSSFVRLTVIMELDLSHNNLSGPIPELVIASMRNAQVYLNLSCNLLTGSIPEEFGLLEMAQAIDISRNRLSGRIPKALGGCRNLITLDVSDNELVGEIPDEVFGQMAMLVSLNLSRNQFQGEVPDSLQNLKHLATLDLSKNRFTGMITHLSKLSSLRQLNLSFNQLQGSVPRTGIFKNISASSLEGNPGLCGTAFLKPCSKKTLSSIPLKILLVLISVASLFTCTALYYVSPQLFRWLKTRREKNRVEDEESIYNSALTLKRFEQRDLAMATGSFSEGNIIGLTPMSTVYRGRLDSGLVVAIKTFNLRQCSKESDKCFTREVKILSKLKHKSLVKVLGYAWGNQQPKVLVLEFMENGNLESVIHEPGENHSRWTLSERINILLSIASGLDYLHSGYDVPIVHCDLKPSNVLLDREWNARVSDFGTARALGAHLEGETSLSSTFALQGTIGYLPPEYAYMRKVTTKVDVFSFGVVVMEFITKRRPTGLRQQDDSPITLPELVDNTLISGGNQLLEFIDPRLLNCSSFNITGVEQIKELLKLSLACTSPEPEHRPDMNQIMSSLLKIKATLSLLFLNDEFE